MSENSQHIEPETPTSRDSQGKPLYQVSDSQQEFFENTTLNSKKTRTGRIRKPPSYLTDNYYHGEPKKKVLDVKEDEVVEEEEIEEEDEEEHGKKKKTPKKSTKKTTPKKKTPRKNMKNTNLSSTFTDLTRQQISTLSTNNKTKTLDEIRKGGTQPLLWCFETGSEAHGLFVNSKYCFVGTKDSYVYALDLKTAKIIHKLSFGSPVLCIVGDRGFLYVGCEDGVLYDCTTGVPRKAYQLSKEQSVSWMDISDGRLTLDVSGTLVVLNIEGETIWESKPESKVSQVNRTVRTDGKKVFHSRDNYLSAYNMQDGKKLWTSSQGGYVTFGAQDETHVYVAPLKVHKIDKETGNKDLEYPNIVPWACTTSDKYTFCSDCFSTIYSFDKKSGQQLWSQIIGSKGLSMQYFEDVLYIAAANGQVYAFDVSDEEKKVESLYVTTKDSQDVDEVKPETSIKKTNEIWGILVKCVKERGRLRIRVDDSVEGYNRDWNIQFPTDLREEGAKYIVQEIIPAVDGGYYRAKGDIEKYEE